MGFGCGGDGCGRESSVESFPEFHEGAWAGDGIGGGFSIMKRG